MGLRWGAHLPDIGRWARRWIDHWVCDAWPVRRQTYGYLPSCRASPPFGRYQIILLRGTWVWTTCPELLLGSGLAGSRTRDLSFTSQRPNHWTTQTGSVGLLWVICCPNKPQYESCLFVPCELINWKGKRCRKTTKICVNVSRVGNSSAQLRRLDVMVRLVLCDGVDSQADRSTYCSRPSSPDIPEIANLSWNLRLSWNLSHLVQMSWYWPLLSVPSDSLMFYLQRCLSVYFIRGSSFMFCFSLRLWQSWFLV